MVESQLQHKCTERGRGDGMKNTDSSNRGSLFENAASTYSKRSGTDQRIFRQHLLDYNRRGQSRTLQPITAPLHC